MIFAVYADKKGNLFTIFFSNVNWIKRLGIKSIPIWEDLYTVAMIGEAFGKSGLIYWGKMVRWKLVWSFAGCYGTTETHAGMKICVEHPQQLYWPRNRIQEDYKSVHCREQSRQNNEQSQWQPPLEGTIKIKTDSRFFWVRWRGNARCSSKRLHGTSVVLCCNKNEWYSITDTSRATGYSVWTKVSKGEWLSIDSCWDRFKSNCFWNHKEILFLLYLGKYYNRYT